MKLTTERYKESVRDELENCNYYYKYVLLLI